MVVIKIKEVPNTKDGLLERVRRAWRINPDRLYNQKVAIAVYKGEILEVYQINGYGPDEKEEGRVQFDLMEVSSPMKGQKISYRTANPCTIVEETDLAFK